MSADEPSHNNRLLMANTSVFQKRYLSLGLGLLLVLCTVNSSTDKNLNIYHALLTVLIIIINNNCMKYIIVIKSCVNVSLLYIVVVLYY